ncbi:MAG: DUF3857 domain-containing protein [Spirochaetes bacterium]|jgi:hypothetical protein|nr:DUF3857 domain-containing protein [Spirochaetota bacterium]
MKRYLLTCAILLFFPPAVYADLKDIERYEKEIHSGYYSGDYNRLYAGIERLLFDRPLDPATVVYYEDIARLADVVGWERAAGTLSRLRETIGKSGSPSRNSFLYRLDMKLEKIFSFSDMKKAAEVSENMPLIRDWIVMGPYKRFGRSDLDQQYLPEIADSISDHSIPRKKIRLKGPGGVLDLKRHVYPAQGAVYALSSFTVKSPVRIRIYSSGRYKVFINGRAVLKNSGPGHRKMRMISVWGCEGISLMIKIMDSPSSRLRVTVTDEKDSPAGITTANDSLFKTGAETAEVEEFDFAYLNGESGRNRAAAHRLMGEYMSGIGSARAVAYFRSSLSARYDPVTELLLAETLLDLSGGERGSAKFLEAWRLFEKLWTGRSDFIPAQYRRFYRLYSESDFEGAYAAGRGMASSSPLFLPGRVLFLDLLSSLGYEMEFEEQLKDFKKKFPWSHYPSLCEARYFKGRDRDKYLASAYRSLGMKRSAELVKGLAGALCSGGEYDRAVAMIMKHDPEGNLTDELIDVYLKKGDPVSARKAAIAGIVKREDPYLYFMLGLMDFHGGGYPEMHWKKMTSLNPSAFSVTDFIEFASSGNLENPLKTSAGGTGAPDKTRYGVRDEKFPSTVIYRGRVFVLYKNGRSRAFCEDVISVNTRKGVERWGDYRVPYAGAFQPVTVRVHSRQGTADSYRIQKVNSDRYINLESLKAGSVIHVSYIIDDPVGVPGGSGYFSLPYSLVQNYDEPVMRLSVRVVAPTGMKIAFFNNRKFQVRKTEIEDNAVYSIDAENLPPVSKENYSGDRRNSLACFSFSSFEGMGEFLAWYRGILPEGGKIKRGLLNRLRGGTHLETMKKTYDFVSRDIELQGNLLYQPDSPENVLYKKGGTPEDKAVLARAILGALGIKSYLALARSSAMPDPGGLVSKQGFTNVILYVPLDVKKGVWLDFSSRHYPMGAVDCDLAGTDAVLILPGDYETKRVEEAEPSLKKGDFGIKIRADGSADCEGVIEFGGQYGRARKYFRDRRYHEEFIASYFGSMVPSLNLDSFEVKNLKDYERNFSIGFRGSGIGLGHPFSGGLMLQPIINKCVVYQYVSYPERKQNLVISSVINEAETYRYGIPAEFRGSAVDVSDRVDSRFGEAEITMKKERGSDLLTVKKRIRIKSYRISPEDYRGFLDFCLALKRMEYRTVTFSRD